MKKKMEYRLKGELQAYFQKKRFNDEQLYLLFSDLLEFCKDDLEWNISGDIFIKIFFRDGVLHLLYVENGTYRLIHLKKVPLYIRVCEGYKNLHELPEKKPVMTVDEIFEYLESNSNRVIITDNKEGNLRASLTDTFKNASVDGYVRTLKGNVLRKIDDEIYYHTRNGVPVNLIVFNEHLVK